MLFAIESNFQAKALEAAAKRNIFEMHRNPNTHGTQWY